MPLTPKLKQSTEYVAKLCDGIVTDWPKIKWMILSYLPPTERRGAGLSRRNESTRKHTLNEVDREVIAYWQELTGVELTLESSRLQEQGWKWKPKGWGLPTVRSRYESSNNHDNDNEPSSR